MYLSRFGVKNYKCLGEIDIPLTPIHVLIGENDAGKTSLLEAMAAFCASSEKPLSDAFPGPWDGRELVRHGSDKPTIELWAGWQASTETEDEHKTSPSRFRYGFEVEFPLEEKRCVTTGDWIEVGGERHKLARASSDNKTSLRRWKKETERSVDEQSRKHLDVISKIVKPAHKYAFDPSLMAVPAAIRTERTFGLDPDGFGLSTLLDDILDYAPELFIRLRTEFCSFFPQFKSVRMLSENGLQREYVPTGIHLAHQQVGKGIYFETEGGQTIRAQQASDGAILFLGFLALAHLPDPPNLLLIEEPENGIYPKRLGEVIKLLKELVHRTEGVPFPQIIMSTHSPYVLSFFEPEEVTFLSRPPDNPDGPVRARPLRDAPNIKERMDDGFYLGELWYNLSEEELFGES